MAAALLMANLQASVRSQCAIALDHPEAFLQAVNQLFFDSTTDGAYATLFFAEYDDRTRRLRYANCGHLPALLLREDKSVNRLESTGTVLGLFEGWECMIRECALSPGDVLALYTDGVTEAFGSAQEEFGERRLIDSIERHRELRPQAMLAAVMEDVKAFAPREQSDDITLIIARCK
jgi:serine phosphatase RsbU (regulator of sigma subunit)